MRCVRYTVFLILFLSASVRADNFVSVAEGQRSSGSFGGSGNLVQEDLHIKLVNTDSLPDTFSLSFALVSVERDPGHFGGVEFPGSFSEVVPAGGTVNLNFANFGIWVRGIPEFGASPVRCKGRFRMVVSSENVGALGTFEFDLSGIIEVGNNVGSGAIKGSSPFSVEVRNTGPVRQVWYQFALANMSDESRSVWRLMPFDGGVVESDHLFVGAGSPSSPTEIVHSGAFVAYEGLQSLLFPGGVLMNGVSVWDPATDEGVWEAAVLFPGGDGEVEDIKLRLGVDVFSEHDLQLVVYDGFGNEVDRLNVVPGLYNSSVDLSFSGFDGHEISFGVVGADNYSVTVLGDEGLSMAGGGAMNGVHVQLHKTDDPPATVGGSTTAGVDAEGRPTVQVVRVYENGLGTMSSQGPSQGPWNPDQRFGGTYVFAGQGNGERVLMAIDAAVGQVAANGAATPDMGGGDGGGYGDSVEGIADGVRGGLGSLPVPESVSSAQEDEWIIQLPPIYGVEVPPFPVPLNNPAVGWFRLVLLIASYAFWLQKTIRFLKT